MELIDKEEINPFRKETFRQEERKNYCVRFLKKKFLCIIVFTILVIAFLEFLKVILEKIDSTTVTSLLNKISDQMHVVNSTFQESQHALNEVLDTTHAIDQKFHPSLDKINSSFLISLYHNITNQMNSVNSIYAELQNFFTDFSNTTQSINHYLPTTTSYLNITSEYITSTHRNNPYSEDETSTFNSYTNEI